MAWIHFSYPYISPFYKIQCIIDADYPWIFIEIFGDEIYKFKKDIDSSKKYTVFDIGANRGYASLYFAQKDYVKDIYAFELVPQTFEFLQKNIDLNPKYKDKIHPYCFGLGKEDCEIIYYSDGRDYAISMCKEAILKTNNNIENIKEQKAKIKKTSNVLKQIIEENSIENIILKIDVEGAEYDIFDDLVENYPEIFDKIVKIVGETHLGFDKFYEKIENYGFEVIWSEPHENGTCLFELCKRGIIQWIIIALY